MYVLFGPFLFAGWLLAMDGTISIVIYVICYCPHLCACDVCVRAYEH